MLQPGTVIFLDIDGVLQPLSSQKRFRHNLEELLVQLASTYQNDEYLKMDRYDLGAVYYDWDKEAVERLKKLCAEFDAAIVISSDWRLYSPLPQLKQYFRLHDLDGFVNDIIPVAGKGTRDEKIADYLEAHAHIERFVILDDAYRDLFTKRFPEHFVYCQHILDESCYQQARSILEEKPAWFNSPENLVDT